MEKGRRATADLFAGMIKLYSFGSSRDVDPGVARFAERLIEATPIDVVAEFYPAFQTHDKSAALQWFADVPVTVVAGDRDMITPAEHSVAIKEALLYRRARRTGEHRAPDDAGAPRHRDRAADRPAGAHRSRPRTD